MSGRKNRNRHVVLPPLTVQSIASTQSDEELLDKLLGELSRTAPGPGDDRKLALGLPKLPRGLRAMAATHCLDVSMTLDDLGWHFGNHRDLKLYEETRNGLRELGLSEMAELFEEAYSIMAPHWSEMIKLSADEWISWYSDSGVKKQIEPLDRSFSSLMDKLPHRSILDQWVAYTRRFPERVVAASEDKDC